MNVLILHFEQVTFAFFEERKPVFTQVVTVLETDPPYRLGTVTTEWTLPASIDLTLAFMRSEDVKVEDPENVDWFGPENEHAAFVDGFQKLRYKQAERLRMSESNRLARRDDSAMDDQRTAPFFLYVLARTNHEDAASETKLETKECLTFEHASDEFALYCEIYGADHAIIVTDTATGEYRFFSFPSIRWALNLTDTTHFKPYVGCAATIFVGESYFPRVVNDIRLNGREIRAGQSLFDHHQDYYTLRKDGAYRSKGTDHGPRLILGVARYDSPREL